MTFGERFLLFNYDNWNVPQPIDVQAFDNAVDFGVGDSNVFIVNITHHVTSYTPGYKEYDRLHHLDDGQPYTMAPTDVLITVFDNDEAGVSFDHSLFQQTDGVNVAIDGYAIEIPEAQPGHGPNYYDYSIQLLCKPSFRSQYPVIRLRVSTNNTRLAVGSAGAEDPTARQHHVFEFTNETWQIAQTIRLILDTQGGEFRSSNRPEVILVEHAIVEGDPEYVDLILPSATVVILDNDVPGVIGFPSIPLYMHEGQTYNVSLTLATEPAAFVDVTLSLALNVSDVLNADDVPGMIISYDGMESDTISHRFYPEEWNTPFIVTLVPQQDFVFEGTYSYDLSLALSSEDELYSLANRNTARVYLEDDDSPGVLVTPCLVEELPCNNTHTVHIMESTSPTPPHSFYEVRLRSEPVAAVAVTVSSADPTHFIVSSDVDAAGDPGQPATVHFAPAAQPGSDDWWRQPQRVRIDARNFNWATTPEPIIAVLNHVVRSEDPSYNDTAVDPPLTTTIVPRQLCINPHLDPADIKGDGVEDGVPTAGHATSFSVVVKDSQGKVCANSWDIITISIEHPDGVSFRWPAGKPERDIVPSIDKVNPRDEPNSNGTVIVHYTVNPHGPYIVTIGVGATQVARTVSNNPLPPPVVSATFDDSLEGVRISFSADIHGHHDYSTYSNYRGGHRLNFPDGYSITHSVSDPPSCATWLASGTVALLGVRPTCTWTNSSHMQIYLGARYALAPGDAFTFNHTLPGSNVSLIAAYNSLPAENSAVVAAAVNPADPVLVLNAQSVVGKCTDVILDASPSLQHSRSRLSFEWSVEEATVSWTGQEDPRCPCVDWADDLDSRAQFENLDGTALIVRLGDPAADFTYPLGYGDGGCAAHDATRQPFCADANGAPLPDAPNMCQASWCWVDPDDCQLSVIASSVFHLDGQPPSRYYSSETCHANWEPVQTELTQQFNNATVTVASDLLPFGETMYVLTITNSHGMSQNATVTVNRSTSPRPTVTIAGPSSYEVTAMDALDLTGVASVVVGPQCVDESQRELTYIWQVRQCAPDQCTWDTAVVLSSRVFDQEQSLMPSVRLEVSRLAVGHKYLVRLSVHTRTNEEGFAEVEVRVDRSQLIGHILVGPLGSGREALQHVVTEADGAVLDASTSRDPDHADASLLYEWQCVSGPSCRTTGAFYEPVWDLARAVSGFGWSPGTHEFRLRVADQSDTDRYSTFSTKLVVPNPNVNHPTVAIVQSPTGKVNPEDRLVLKAHAIGQGRSSQLDLRWSSVDFLNLGAAASGTLDSANLVVKGDQLEPGSAYRFKILACAGPCEVVNPSIYSYYDEVTVVVNEPPSSSGDGGVFVTTSGQRATGSSVTPMSGVSLVDEFTMVAGWDWQDEDLPISYAYAAQIIGVTKASLLMRPSLSTSAKSLLPAGLDEHGNQVEIICIITDSLGASSEAQANVTVLPPALVDRTLVDDKLLEAQDLKNVDMLLQRMDAISNLLNRRGNRRRMQSAEETDQMALRSAVLEKVPLAQQWSLPSQSTLSRILQTVAMATVAPDELNSQTVGELLEVLDSLLDSSEYASLGLAAAAECFTVADHVFDTLRSRASDAQFNHPESISLLTQFISEAAQSAGAGLVAGEAASRFRGSDSFDVTIQKFDELGLNRELTIELAAAENVTFVLSASPAVTARATAWSLNPHDYTQPDDGSSVLVTPVVRLELQANADESSVAMFPVQVTFPSAHLDADAQHPEKFLSLVGWLESDWVSVGSLSSGVASSSATNGRRMQVQSGPTFDITSLLVGGLPVHELGVQELLDYNTGSIPELCSPVRIACEDTLNDNDSTSLGSVPFGQFLLVECESQCNSGVIGSQIYSADSTICAAARHSCGHEAQHQSEVSCEWEGWKTFAVVLRPGRTSYSSSTTTVSLEPERTISSAPGGQTDRSFQIIARDCVLPLPEPEPEPVSLPAPEQEPAPPPPPQPVDCEGTWGQWSDCTEPCGGGQETRSFLISTASAAGGQACPGPETRPCALQPCPVDCYIEYLPCTDACESASERRFDENSYQAPEHGGAPCPDAEDCADGEGGCEFLSGIVPDAIIPDAIVPEDDDTALLVAMMLVVCALVAAVGCYVRKSKQAVAESEQWNSAALSQQIPTPEDGAETGMPKDVRRPTTPQRGGSRYGQSVTESPTGSLSSQRGFRYGGDNSERQGGSNYSTSNYGDPTPRGPPSVRSDGSSMSRKAEREARLAKARSLVANKSNSAAPATTRATTPPRRMSQSSATDSRRLSPARPRGNLGRGATVFAAAATASAVGATKPRSAAFARAQLLLAQSQSRRAMSTAVGQPASPPPPGSATSAQDAIRRLTPTRTGRTAAASARLRAATPPRDGYADGDNE